MVSLRSAPQGGRSLPVSAKLRADPARPLRSRALPKLPAAPRVLDVPAALGSSPAESLRDAGAAACTPCAAGEGLRCTPVIPSATCAVGAQSTCSRVLPCIPPAGEHILCHSLS